MGRYFLVIFVSLAVLLAVVLGLLFSLETNTAKVAIKTKEIDHTEIMQKMVSRTFEDIVSDLIFISKHREFRSWANVPELNSFEEFSEELLLFSAQKEFYDQIRLLDMTGKEVFRINYNNGEPVVVPEDELQFKENRYYFKECIKLKNDEMYISPFDLNIENWRIEYPLKPTIRFCLPVVSAQGKKHGILIFNYLGANLIEDIKAMSIATQGDDLIVNSDGYFLVGLHADDEWGFMFKDKKAKTFHNTFPDESDIVFGGESGQFYTENGLFTFATVYPSREIVKWNISSFNNINNSKTGDNYWKIVMRVPPHFFNQRANELRTIFLPFYFVSIFLIGLVSRNLARNQLARKKAEKKLYQREASLAQAQETAQLGSYELDISTSRVSWSKQMFRLFGFEIDEVSPTFELVKSMIHPDDVEEWVRAYEHAIQDCIPLEHEYRIIRKNGEERTVNSRGKLLLDDTQRPLKFVGTAQDTTDRKKVEEELLINEERLELAMSVNNDGIYDWDVATNKIYFDSRYYTMAGYEPNEYLGTFAEWAKRVHQEDYPKVEIAVKAYLNGESKKYDEEFRFRRKDGEWMWIRARVKVFKRDEQGAPLRIIGTHTDITERKQVEEERERLLTAISQSAEAIVITDIKGDIIHANPAFEQITGYTPEEAIGQNPRILKGGMHDKAFYKNLWGTITTGKTWEGILINKKKNGTIFEEKAIISPVVNAKGEIINYVAVKRDVTAERNLERAKAFFTNITSHELRTPLTQLKLLKMLLGDLAETYHDDEKAVKSKELTDKIYLNLNRVVSATSLQSDLISEVKVPFYPILIKSLLEYQVETVQHEAREEGRDISINIELGGLPEKTSILGSQEMIEKAFAEILSNAIKYTPDRSGVSVKSVVSAEEVVIDIFNEGEGIPKENIESLFAPYFSIENVLEYSTGKYKHKGGGIGLGLTITKMIVEYHGGSITIKLDTDQKGTCITLRFPLAK